MIPDHTLELLRVGLAAAAPALVLLAGLKRGTPLDRALAPAKAPRRTPPRD